MASFWKLGCLYGASSVVFGAFGAHSLKTRISDPAKIASWFFIPTPQTKKLPSPDLTDPTPQTQQLIHSGALLLAEIAAPRNVVAKGLFAAGMTMFSGSIYLLVLDPERFRPLGPVTPLGGLCLIGGWVALAFGSRGRIVGGM
ncbi:hypothetical protein LTR28_010004 [Elasticomyces elasticus]|nr:hypothetical protein LTR28_010004 [Elasticomyces elasticus]